jgi:DNA-binding HxlR family transcriptional regulator
MEPPVTGKSSRSTPTAVRGSTTGRPLMAAMDLLGRRWALRILWELRDGPIGARALRDRCDGMSSSVLYDRLRDLTEAVLIERTAQGAYLLTPTGAALGRALRPLDEWAVSWALDTTAPRAKAERSRRSTGS